MIALKDIAILATLAGSIIPGGIYIHDVKRDVIVLSQEFIGDQMIRNQKDIWAYEDRLKSNPSDNSAWDRLRSLEYEKKLLEYKRQQLK